MLDVILLSPNPEYRKQLQRPSSAQGSSPLTNAFSSCCKALATSDGAARDLAPALELLRVNRGRQPLPEVLMLQLL